MADPAQSFSSGFQLGVQDAGEAQRQRISMAQIAEQKRQFDVVQDLRSQEFDLRRQAEGVALQGVKTRNSIAELGLQEEQQKIDSQPKLASWLATVSNTPIPLAAQGKFDPIPDGLPLEYQQQALKARATVQAQAQSQIEEQVKLKIRADNLMHADRLAGYGINPFNEDGSLNEEKMYAAQEELNQAQLNTFAQTYPEASKTDYKVMFDRRGELTPAGKINLQAWESKRKSAEAERLAKIAAEGRGEIADERSKISLIRNYRNSAADIRKEIEKARITGTGLPEGIKAAEESAKAYEAKADALERGEAAPTQSVRLPL